MSWNWSNITGQNKSSEAIIETGGHISVYKMPERGVFEGSKISNSLSVLASNTKRQWSLWKTFIRPALNSLPAGVRDERWTLNSKIDALVYGIQGATIMVNNDASATSSGGRYWDADNERPKTIAETLEDLYDSVASLQSLGLDIAQSTNLGYIGTFIGMTDPTVSEMPVYSSTSFVSQSVSLETAIGQLDLALSGISVSLDGAYNTGSDITADDGAVTITVPDDSNNSALTITNNDVTNNPNAISITNEGSGRSIFLTGTGVAQSIWSDQSLTIGSSASPDGLNIHNTVSSGESAIEILSYSDDSSAETTITSLGIGGPGSVEIAANGVSNLAPCSVAISASNSGSETSYVVLGTEQTGSIRFNNEDLYGSSWSQAYIPLSGSSGEFDTFKTNFGEVSLLNAINQTASGGSIRDWGYLDTTGPSGSSGPTLVYQLDGTVNQLNERVSGTHNLSAGVSPYLFVSNTPLSSLGTTLASSGSSYTAAGSLYTTSLTNSQRPIGAVTCEWVGCIYKWITSTSLFSIRDSGSASNGCSLINFCCSNGYGAMQIFIEYNSSGSDEKKLVDWIAPIGVPLYIALTRDSSGLTYKLYVNGTLIDTVVFVNAPYLSATPTQELGLLCEYKSGSLRDNDFGGCVSSFRMTVGEEFSQSQITEVWNSIKPIIE